MLKRLSVISVLALLLVIILVLAPGSACDQGAKQAEVPAGPPRILSFKVASENVAPDEAPLFTWEVANAKAVTITQDGVEIYHIEALPDSDSGAFLIPLHDKAYASTSDENEVYRPYMPGIYPAGFNGGTNGKPSRMVGEPGHKVFLFPENWVEPELRDDRSSLYKETGGDLLHSNIMKDTAPGSAEISVLSPDGQVTTAKVAYIFESIADPTDIRNTTSMRITPPPCVKSNTAEHIIPAINRWSVKNPVIKDGEAPQFEFEVTNPHIISIRHGDEYISSVEIINPPVTSGISLPSLTDKVHASTTGENEFKQPYSPGIYPSGKFTGSDNNKPSKVAWKFGEKSQEDSAEITVCSPTGDIVSATVTFNIMRVEEQVQPSAALKPPVITFTASRNIVGPLDPVTFTWNVTGDNLTVKLVSDGSQRTVSPSGSESIIIMKSACYYITAENPAGRASESQCITIQTSGFMQPPPIVEPPCPTDNNTPPLAPPRAAP